MNDKMQDWTAQGNGRLVVVRMAASLNPHPGSSDGKCMIDGQRGRQHRTRVVETVHSLRFQKEQTKGIGGQ